MKLLELSKYSFSDQLMIRTIGETTMVYNPENGDMYEMNETAALLIEYLIQGISGKEIINRICKEYDVDEETVAEDLEPLLGRIIEIGLLVVG